MLMSTPRWVTKKLPMFHTPCQCLHFQLCLCVVSLCTEQAQENSRRARMRQHYTLGERRLKADSGLASGMLRREDSLWFKDLEATHQRLHWYSQRWLSYLHRVVFILEMEKMRPRESKLFARAENGRTKTLSSPPGHRDAIHLLSLTSELSGEQYQQIWPFCSCFLWVSR